VGVGVARLREELCHLESSRLRRNVQRLAAWPGVRVRVRGEGRVVRVRGWGEE
jgi:hypothetical protein